MAVARPLLLGGSCSETPRELLLAWSSSPESVGASTANLHALGIALASDQSADLSPSWEQNIDTSPVFPELIFSTATSPIATTVTRSGRIFLAAATVNLDSAVGDLQLHKQAPAGAAPPRWAPWRAVCCP